MCIITVQKEGVSERRRVRRTLNHMAVFSVIGYVGQEQLGTVAGVIWALLRYHDQIN